MTVAMQSTGVYWIPLCDILEERGFRCSWSTRVTPRICPGAKRCAGVPVVAAVAHLRIVQQLISADQPDPGGTDVLAATSRTCASGASCIQRMQKAPTQMDVQLANVISDLSRLTGR
jgi:transposase